MRKATVLSNAEKLFAQYQQDHIGKGNSVCAYNAMLEQLEFLRHHVRDRRQSVECYAASYDLMQSYAAQ